MSEKDNKNVRRFSRRNQKDKLRKPDSLFPVADDLSEGDNDLSTARVDFDMDGLDLPDTDSEALAMLSSLRDEVKAPIITPKEERYPPIAPVQQPSRQSAPAQAVSPKKEGGHALYNFLTLFFIVGTIATLIWFALVWIDPQSPLNPLPPATPFVQIEVTMSSDSATAVTIDATPDESGQIFVVITDTPMPTQASTDSPFPFISDTVLYAPNSNELSCNWWSIAGTVSDLEGNPLSGYRIRVLGEEVNEVVFSGVSQAFGEGGYELPLVGTPREVIFTVQLFSAQDAPLSDEISLRTRADCDSNVAILNFQQNR